MENVLLVVHLILAICLIGIVLLQRSEGGGLGMGGGGGVMTGRQAATAMTKLTWAFAAAFLTTSVVLTVLAAQNASSGSVLDGMPLEEGAEDALLPPPTGGLGEGGGLLPPTTGDAPLAPPRSE
jgi:preprotein translocase subunit SecG